MINFANVKKIEIPNGNVKSISVGGQLYWESQLLNYINLVPQATDKNGSPFGTNGYSDGYYLSSSGWDAISADASCVVTGYMPLPVVTSSDELALYIKGVALDTSKSHVRLALYNPNRGIINGSGGSYRWDNTVKSIEELGANYYKVVLDNREAYGTIGFVRFSSIGSGANLIVTANQPIPS